MRDLLLLLLLLPLALGACRPRATPEQCRTACDRVAQLRVGPLRKERLAMLHEQEERVEALEGQAKVDLARIRAELAEGSPPFDERPFRARHAPASEIRMARERHAWEAEQLRAQRTAGIAQTEASLADEKKGLAEARKKADAEIAKAISDASAACSAGCVTRSQRYAECLQRTQAVEDVATCDAG